jgi:uncharacterized RDD family membrane protein YckC
VDLENPFTPPVEDKASAPEQDISYLRDASIGLRFFNFVIDAIALRVLMSASVVIAGALGLPLFAAIPDWLLRFGSFVLYYIVLEATTQRTIGKFFTKTKVIANRGSKPSLEQIIGRSFARLIPFEPLTFFSARGGWHDRLTRTRVVRVLR